MKPVARKLDNAKERWIAEEVVKLVGTIYKGVKIWWGRKLKEIE